MAETKKKKTVGNLGQTPAINQSFNGKKRQATMGMPPKHSIPLEGAMNINGPSPFQKLANTVNRTNASLVQSGHEFETAAANDMVGFGTAGIGLGIPKGIAQAQAETASAEAANARSTQSASLAAAESAKFGTALENEFAKRDSQFIQSGDNYRSVGGSAIDPEKLKMLKNAGLVTGIKSSDDIAQGQHEAWMHNYKMLLDEGRSPEDAKAMADNRRGGRSLGAGVDLGPKVTHVGAPSRGGFFENLGRYSAMSGANKRARADEQFDRKQSLAEASGQAAIDLKTKQADWYDEEARSKVDKRDEGTKARQIENKYLAETLAAKNGLTVAKTQEIINTAGYKKLMAEAKYAKMMADKGHVEAKTQLLKIEQQMQSMFLDKGE